MIGWLVILVISCCGLAFACYRLHQKRSRELAEHDEKVETLIIQLSQMHTIVNTTRFLLSGELTEISYDMDWLESMRILIEDIGPQIEELKITKDAFSKENRALKRQVEIFRQDHRDLSWENDELKDENKVLKDEAAKNKEDKEQNELVLKHSIQKQESLLETNKRISQENDSLRGSCFELKRDNGSFVAQILQNDAKIRFLTEINNRLQAKLREYQGPDNKELSRKLEEGEKRWQLMQEQKAKVVEHNRKLKSALKKVEHENHRLKENNFQLEQQVHVGLVERSKRIGGEAQFDGGGSQQTCVVCWNSPLNVMISPCNHVCLCKKCSSKVEEACPICKASIEEKVNVFIS